VNSSISLLLVDDSDEFREGLKTLLSFFPVEFRIVGEAKTAQQALDLIAEHCPRLTLLDMELEQGSGLEVLRQLMASQRHGPVLALSAHQEEDWIFRAMQAGAMGYVCKPRVATQLAPALESLLGGKVYLAPELTTQFFHRFQRQAEAEFGITRLSNLTEREQEVLSCLVQGASNQAISQKLYITIATVKAHLTAIFEKLDVQSRTQAIVKALQLGLVTAYE
jgi:DNA-binding NarL/FixJ family response regulator